MTRIESRHVAAATGLALVGGYVYWLMWSLQHRTYDQWGALIIGPALVLITLPILVRMATGSEDPWFFRLAVTGLVLKLLASMGRYWVAFVYYRGVADAAGYDGAGRRLAASYREGNFHVDLAPGGVGTHFLQIVTGVVYTVAGPSLLGGYLVFAWMGFLGVLLFYRAFQVALPGGNRRRYALMVFFLPSLLFWPSGIGKEAWMMLGLGMCALGAALLLGRRRGGIAILALGIAATAAVRPHVTLLVAAALVVSYSVRRSRRITSLTPVVKVVGVLFLVVLAYVVLRQTASFLDIQDLSVSGFDGALQQAQSRTAQGGSQFAGAAITSPLSLPWAVVTVIFRPFPWEADSGQALAASAEGVLLVYLTWHFRRALAAVPRLLRSNPYVTFSLVYLLGYILIFSGFSNFGILVRERSLALPAFLVLLALPARVRPDSPPPARRLTSAGLR